MSKRHFIPEQFKYNPKSDSKRELKDHLNTYLSQTDKTPVIIYVHGNDRDR
jgi:hypothetical protein